MSFRNTFVTDFIYAGGDEQMASKAVALGDAFRAHCSVVEDKMTERGMGYFAGFIKTSNLDVNLAELELESLVNDLEKATPVPFRFTVMQESGATITYTVNPRSKEVSS